MPMNDLKPTEAAFARAGKIRLGIKVKNKKGVEHPQETEYFVLNDVPELADFFRSTTGNDRPTELPIFFPFDDIEQNMNGWHKLHLASSVYCKGDGERVVYAIDQNTGQRVIDKGRVIRDTKFDGREFRPGDIVNCPGYNKVDGWKRCEYCSPHTTIKFMIRGLPVESIQMATYHIETISVNNYGMLYEQMLGIKELARRLTGREYLAGIPIILQRKKETIGAPNLDKQGNRKQDGTGKLLPARMRTEHYLLSLTVEPEWVKAVMERQMKLAGGTIEEMPALVSGVQTDIVEAEVISDEQIKFANDDFDRFIDNVLENIKFYGSQEQVEEAMVATEIVYDPENEEFIFDSLARYATQEADKAAAQVELPF